MVRKRRKDRQAGRAGFVPRGAAEQRAQADALLRFHEGHQCAERAEALSEAANYYAMLGEHDLAERLYREALEIDEAEPGVVQSSYASFLFDRGRAAEALDLIAAARRLDPEAPEVFAMIGETLLENDHPQPAARWFTLGIVRLCDSLADVSLDDLRHDMYLAMLARGRREAREKLGLAPDHIDEMVGQLAVSNSG
jgi:tetratricopeptide (TPR) repeat protein